MNDFLTEFFSGAGVRSFCGALILAVLGIFAIRILCGILSKTLERSHLEAAAHRLVLSLCKTILYLLLGLSVASRLGIDVTGVVAMASVLTLAVSLSLQNMLSNVIGGFTILYTHPFRSGDFVEIGSQSGTVKEINMSYTVLTTPDNKILSIPNSSVVAAQIMNYSASETRRVDIAISAGYDSPVEDTLAALLEAARLEKVLETPAPQAVVLGYGDNAIDYSLRLWVSTPDYWDVFFRVNQNIKKVFDQRTITMTYPHLNVHLN